jgi:hypothetical protein
MLYSIHRGKKNVVADSLPVGPVGPVAPVAPVAPVRPFGVSTKSGVTKFCFSISFQLVRPVGPVGPVGPGGP